MTHRLHLHPARPTGAAVALPSLLLAFLLAACGGSDDGPSGPVDPPTPPANADPVARFTVQATGSAAPVGASFDASGSSDSDGQVVSWSWSFGDGTSATGATVEHVFDAPGSFPVQLTVTDDDGATATTSQTLEVEELAPDQVAGVVWFDRNGDGTRQSGEEGVPDMTVFVDADADGELDAGETRTTTGVAGIYQLQGLAAGEHRVTQALGIGWTSTAAAQASQAAPPHLAGPQRILGGENAAAGAWPFMASIQIAAEDDPQKAHICGGSLIAPQWVLTASHCLSDDVARPFPPGALEVLLGTHRLDGSGTRVPVEATFINPGYSPAGGFYKRDVSVVKLARRMETTPRVFLMDSTLFQAEVATGDQGTLIGWGRTGDAEPIPVDLQIAPIPLRRDGACEDAWNDGEVIRFESSMLCVGHQGGTPDSCAGDSGGPWMFEVAGRWYQLGAVSWGPVPCGRPAIPSAYASVPAMIDFVRATVPTEPSQAVVVTLSGEAGARVDFGNFH